MRLFLCLCVIFHDSLKLCHVMLNASHLHNIKFYMIIYFDRIYIFIGFVVETEVGLRQDKSCQDLLYNEVCIKYTMYVLYV